MEYLLAPLPHRAHLDALHRIFDVHDALHENSRRHDEVGLDFAGLDQMLDLGDGDLAGGRHDRIEVPRGLAIDEIALGVALPRVDDRQIRDEPAFHHIVLAIEFARVLALADRRAVTGLRVERGNAGTAGADALGTRALRIEFALQLAFRSSLAAPFVP